MADKDFLIVTSLQFSDVVEDYLGFMDLADTVSFKGWLTTLDDHMFSRVESSFDELEADMFILILSRMFGEAPEVGQIVSEENYGNYRLLCEMDLAEIGLYKKGFLKLHSRDERGWVFTPTPKAYEYLKLKDGNTDTLLDEA